MNQYIRLNTWKGRIYSMESVFINLRLIAQFFKVVPYAGIYQTDKISLVGATDKRKAKRNRLRGETGNNRGERPNASLRDGH